MLVMKNGMPDRDEGLSYLAQNVMRKADKWLTRVERYAKSQSGGFQSGYFGFDLLLYWIGYIPCCSGDSVVQSLDMS